MVWLRRDLRLTDNTALEHAFEHYDRVSLLFIYDTDILETLPRDDRRMTFIAEGLADIKNNLHETAAGPLIVLQGRPIEVIKHILVQNKINAILFNRDYEPFALQRDDAVKRLCRHYDVACLDFKDQVIFGPDEILKDDGQPYRVFTAYKNRWLDRLADQPDITRKRRRLPAKKFFGLKFTSGAVSRLSDMCFSETKNILKGGELAAHNVWNAFKRNGLYAYPENRNRLCAGTSQLSPYLRFGNISIRELVADLITDTIRTHVVFLNELIWREFFMMILRHYPHVVDTEFQENYRGMHWPGSEDHFTAWCEGRTGFPVVDAGMRALNATGLMHNRARMITASFLVKHLHVDWRLGERYFARQLLDYELSSNNGNWQWTAGTGVDAAPYFRIFHPVEQGKKFDPDGKYIKEWIPELRSVAATDIHNRRRYKQLYEENKSLAPGYPAPLIDLDEERLRSLLLYRNKN